MSFYKVGCQARTGLIVVENPSSIVGASQEQPPPKKNDKLTFLVVLGLAGLIYIGIPALRKGA